MPYPASMLPCPAHIPCPIIHCPASMTLWDYPGITVVLLSLWLWEAQANMHYYVLTAMLVFTGKAQANEQRYIKLKEKYSELVHSHADLLRKNAEMTRQVTLVHAAAQDEVEGVRREMQVKVKAAQQDAQQQDSEQLEQMLALQMELLSSRAALETLRHNLAASQQAQANEQRYIKLKEKYSELVHSHADLLRKNAEMTRQVTLVHAAAQDEVEGVRREMQVKVKAAQQDAQQQDSEQLEQMLALQMELLSSRAALETLRHNLAASQQSNEELSSRLPALETESVELARAVAQKEAELARAVAQKEAELASLKEELKGACSRLAHESEAAVKATETLQNQLNDKESRELALGRQLVAGGARGGRVHHAGLSVPAGRPNAHQLHQLRRFVSTIKVFEYTALSVDYLVSRTQTALDCVDQLQAASDQYLSDEADVSEMLRCVARFAHLIGDNIVQGSATSHMAPMDQTDVLAEDMRTCGTETLALLGQLKEQKILGVADGQKLTAALNRVRVTAEKLRPRGLELHQGEQEMAATSTTVETAAARIEEMLSKSRAVDTGVKMEVNERILASCTVLMQAIKELVLSSKDLQRDIVENGRGAASMKEFYARNSCWTEALISASKAVGWGATVMVDAADLVVQGQGKFEELMVCSHEIAASTAQLIKRQEMDSQVQVLQLETLLQRERERLGELRKKYYELASMAEV
ncbi:hypothetical protein SKAU_G00087820 [Synaphobranchus kaupii]|uniref:I/LWEQ domain-containing protein n=1 Tax=Synaphobranchus kaupii TaxID=118154 RepID=A0A9Q1FVR9_SYNKA|nr:hypothetical protein SKAU_G00087820 [Synaphobranchus kaupii]